MVPNVPYFTIWVEVLALCLSYYWTVGYKRLLASHVFCILMVGTTDSFKFHLTEVHTWFREWRSPSIGSGTVGLLLGGASIGTVGLFSTPRMIVSYLGFLADSSKEVFYLLPEKKRHPRNMITRRSFTPGTIKTGRVLRSQTIQLTGRLAECLQWIVS